MTTRFYIPTPSARALVALLALACCTVAAALAASPARAEVAAYGEPAYTKTSANNTYWFHWTAVTGINSNGGNDSRYYLCFSTTKDGTTVESHAGSNGPGSTNCTGSLAQTGNYSVQPFTGAGYTLEDGHYYGMCATGYSLYVYIWAIDNTSINNCVGTRIDRNKPQVTVSVDGTKEFTNDPQLAFHIDYQDATSPPWQGSDGKASNWRCISRGGPCTPSGNYDPNCSVPNVANSRINSFDCSGNFAAEPDGDYYFCAFAADAAVADNPNGTNQGGTSNNANLSDTKCGHVVLDRQGPTVTPQASATNVTAGQLVSFTGAASDPTGVQGTPDWDFGDNTPHGSGTATTHTYTQPGTYVARLSSKDNAGNTGSGTVTINVAPAPTGGNGGGGNTGGTGGNNGGSTGGNTGGGTGGNTGGNTGGGTPGTSTGTSGATPAENVVTPVTIAQQNGGGGAQSAAVGSLDVIAPKSIKQGRKQVVLALTPDTAGKLQVALLKGSKIVSTKGAVFGGGGTYTLKLKVPAKAKPGAYRIKLSFTPQGATRATTKTLALKITKKARSGAHRKPQTPDPSRLHGKARDLHAPRRAAG